MFDTSTMLASTVNFILLLIILTRLLYKPVRSFLDERTRSIEQQIKSANEQNEAAAKLHNQLEAELKQSKQKAKEYLDQAVRRGEEIQTEMVAEAKKEADLIYKRTKEELTLERAQLKESLKDEVADLAITISAKIIQDSLDQAKHQKLIDDALNTLEQQETGEWQ